MSEERAVYHIAQQETAKRTAQEVIQGIATRATDNLLWLLEQLDDDQAKEILEAIIKAQPALAREILDNMDNVKKC